MARGSRFTALLLMSAFALTCAARGDENLKTPYVTLDPSSQPPPPAPGKPITPTRSNPAGRAMVRSDLGLPTVRSTRDDAGEHITLGNTAMTFRVTISPAGRAAIEGLREGEGGVEMLEGASPVFILGAGESTSDDFAVVRWDAFEHPDCAELRVEFARPGPAGVMTWKARLFRTRPQLEQEFEAPGLDRLIAQGLRTRASLQPVMPADVFRRGFVGGVPNLAGRHRFEIVQESDHLCYDAQSEADGGVGLWGFVADIGGQERVACGRFTLIQHPSFRTRGKGSGVFVIQPFRGPIEAGFLGLRRFIQRHYAVQAETPAVYEWNQFWLWQGGPTRVDTRVVTEARLFDVLPRQLAMGLEEFHLDNGWERGPGDWQLATDRFPGGWDALRAFNRRNGLAFHLWINDKTSDSADALTGLIEKSNLSRLFMDRQVSEATAAAVAQVRARFPNFSTSCHNSVSRSQFWTWGDLHFLGDFNQIYFGEGQFWLWSNVLPEAKIEPRDDPNFPQRTEAAKFFSRHDLFAGDLVTRSAAYQAQWVWPINCTSPPHCGWAWFEDRPIDQLRDRIYTYLASRFAYQWGEDPAMLTPEARELHRTCTAWFKANRSLLVHYRHVLNVPDGKHVDGAAHLNDGRGFVFLFNPAQEPQAVEWRDLLWEPELELSAPTVTLSDWTPLNSFAPLPPQTLAEPSGGISVPARGVRVIGVNLDDDRTLARIRAERKQLDR